MFSDSSDVPLSKDESNVLLAKNRNTAKFIVLVSHPLYTRRPNGHTILLTERFSSITRLLGTLAIILRWLRRRRLSSTDDRCSGIGGRNIHYYPFRARGAFCR